MPLFRPLDFVAVIAGGLSEEPPFVMYRPVTVDAYDILTNRTGPVCNPVETIGLTVWFGIFGQYFIQCHLPHGYTSIGLTLVGVPINSPSAVLMYV